MSQIGPGSPARSPERLLLMEDIVKSFSGVRVLDSVRFELLAGEVHVLAGENGAGKSTLIKILSGAYSDYQGTIRLGERTVNFRSPQEALANGISVIYQEISLVGPMSVADNIFLGRETVRAAGWLAPKVQQQEARRLLEELGLEVDVTRPVEEYPVSVQQMVEIVKALSYDSQIIVMDEPTSSLTEPEVERLFAIIGVLKQRGCGIIYISHKMEEIYRIADRITVLRDGRYVGTRAAAELPQAELIRWMVGREISQQFPRRDFSGGPVILKVEHLTVPGGKGAAHPLVDDVSFEVRAGEILGLAGLQGSGNSDLLNGLFGTFGATVRGSVSLEGRPFEVRSPAHSIDRSLALLTNDRKANGMVPQMSISHNLTLASLEKFSALGWIESAKEIQAGRNRMESLRIKAASLFQEVGTLSGGNQQKVILGKWLETGPRVLFLDEPTRGVDVAVKHEIYELMNQWTAAGCAILLITSEMPELLAMADRILVMYRGRVSAELDRRQATQEKILQAAMGETSVRQT
ncbi:MAG: sugar ABC transporter ATP-binding protein [Candidatus Glassbacteria bacterium]|nr:sugar ABC transporter ATP-binding protein [Candidatus Glassbacteria bacterium]